MAFNFDNYSHLVTFDKENRRFIVDRYDPESKKALLLTYVDLPEKKMEEDKDTFVKFVKYLGLLMCTDNEYVREILDITYVGDLLE